MLGRAGEITGCDLLGIGINSSANDNEGALDKMKASNKADNCRQFSFMQHDVFLVKKIKK